MDEDALQQLHVSYGEKIAAAYAQGQHDKAVEIGRLRRERERAQQSDSAESRGKRERGNPPPHESSLWHLRYFDELLTLTCNVDLLDAEVFNVKAAAKELTEAFAAFAAVRRHLCGPDGFNDKDPDVTVVVVGDGSTPRAGAVFALRTQWTVVSVDPQMRLKGAWQTIKRLSTHRCKIEEMTFDADKLIFVMVHCHVSIAATVATLTKRPAMLGVVAAPCCDFDQVQGDVYGEPPSCEFEDVSMASGRRHFRVWLLKSQS